jgi:hypothetical protein
MKRVFYNSALVMVLMAVFSVPLAGFKFISYEEPFSSVLGVSNSRFVKDTEIVEQFEYNVVLASEMQQQTLYDVIPFSYIKEYSNFVVFIPKEYYSKGISVELIKNSDSLDMVFSSESILTKSLEVPATILVLK